MRVLVDWGQAFSPQRGAGVWYCRWLPQSSTSSARQIRSRLIRVSTDEARSLGELYSDNV